MGSRQHQMSARVITSDVAWHGMAWLGVGFEGSRDCLASKQCPILKVSSMKKRLFSSETFDAAIPTLFPRDIDETIRELVEKSIVRVIGQSSMNSDVVLDEIADEVVGEEFDKLPEKQRNAVEGRIVEEITDRLKEMIRGEVWVVLRANARVTT